MGSGEFLLTSIVALFTVFIVLTVLAVLIRILTAVFSQKFSDDEPAIIAAISSHYRSNYPQTKIIKIEEPK